MNPMPTKIRLRNQLGRRGRETCTATKSTDARESYLDAEVSSAGEDFYEDRPCYVPPQPSLVSASPQQHQQQQIDAKIESPSNTIELQK